MNVKWFFFLPLLLVGCAGPHYAGSAIRGSDWSKGTSIALVRNDAAGKPFHDAIEVWLKGHGYAYKVVPAGSKPDPDGLTLEYSAAWGMDLAEMYIRKGAISASTLGKEVGRVEFSSPNSLNTKKWGSPEQRVGYMLDVLFGKMSEDQANQVVKTR